jgi:hypothetical protein
MKNDQDAKTFESERLFSHRRGRFISSNKKYGSGANMNSHVNMDKKCSGKYEDHRNEIIIRIIQMEAF